MGTEKQGACGNTRHRETKSDIMPPSGSRVLVPYTIQWGGWVGAQEASRAAPIPEATLGTREAMVDPGTRAAMADPGTRAAMADPGTRAAMADQGTLWTIADRGLREAMADQGTPWTMADQRTRAATADQGTHEAMVGPLSSPRPQPPPRPLWHCARAMEGAVLEWALEGAV